MDDSVGSHDSLENWIDAVKDSISQYGDMIKAEEENQKSALSEKMINLEEENQRLMEENKELVEKEVYRSLKVQMNKEWMNKMCSELEMKEQEIISLTAVLQQANSEVERLERERCDFNSICEDKVCEMRAEWELKMTTELEKKDEDMVELKKAYHKIDAAWQDMEHELFPKERYHKETVAQMEAEWETVKDTLTHVCSQLQALHHERNAAEATKQLQEKDVTILAMETTHEDLQKLHQTLTEAEENQLRQMDPLVNENSELKELALMVDKQKAEKQKEQDKVEKKNKEKDGKLGFLRKYFCCF